MELVLAVAPIIVAPPAKPTEDGKLGMKRVAETGGPCNFAAKRPTSRNTVKSGREDQSPAMQFAGSLIRPVGI